MDATSLSKWLHGSVAKQENKSAFFGEDAEFDGFSSLMSDFQSIKSNEVQLSIKEAAWTVCHVSVMNTNSHGGGGVSRSWQICFAELTVVFGLETYFCLYCYWCPLRKNLKEDWKKGREHFV